MITFESTRQGYLNLWQKIQVRPEKVVPADAVVKRIIARKTDYAAIEKATGVPWFLIAAIHYRESDLDFDTYLGNGQALKKVTTQVPRGRGPFVDFMHGAIDALTLDGLPIIKDWPIERVAWASERENGEGYFSRNINSPYLWAGSNLYEKGKFISDGVFDSEFVDPQLGTIVIINRLVVAKVVSFAVDNQPTVVQPKSDLSVIIAAFRAVADGLEKGLIR